MQIQLIDVNESDDRYKSLSEQLYDVYSKGWRVTK
jgi:hypothetical protein